ncbi:MAG: Gfo/Idh/MocA family oxidoreductase [Clostridiales bacterium]|jgi:predicted dehydrogenase|nr:Gfo/Idh/MocA family oxidoreductase [Clostridiales bacterium]
MDKLKIGIIGTGNIAAVHLDAYRKDPRCEIYALCDLDPKVLAAKGEQYGVKRLYADYNAMLKENPEIGAVSVCTWNSAHAPAAIAALNAGKHVLCEKPMAMNAREAAEMKKAAERNKKILTIGFVRRFGSDCAMVQDFINGGSVGEIYYAKAAYIRRNGCPGGWFGDKSRSGGGPLIDLGVHVIDLVRYLAGSPKAVSVYGATFTKLKNRAHLKSAKAWVSIGQSEKDVFDVEDLAAAMIRFDNGMVLNVETSFTLNLEKDYGKMELFGVNGGIKLDPTLSLYTEMNGYLADVKAAFPVEVSFEDVFAGEIRHFTDAVLTGSPLKVSADDGVEMMKILDAVYASAQSGHEVLV